MLHLLACFKKASKLVSRHYCNTKIVLKAKEPPWKIMFFGSDDFSLHSLKALFNESKNLGGIINTLEVVTCSQQNPIWKFSTDQNLKIHKWPPNLQKSDFDLGIVVSFGYLIPENIIEMFPLGMVNVHASLLPRWRGASPIVYAIANGDRETGVTVMRIRPKKFDVGEILWQEKVPIPTDIEMPELHKKLGLLGASCLLNVVQNVEKCLAQSKPQLEKGVTYAPKLTPEFGKIKWNSSTATDIYNLQRALKSVFPLTATWFSVPVKLYEVCVWQEARKAVSPGFVEYSRKHKLLIVECANLTWISVKRVGVQGKRIMSAADFYNGFISKVEKNTICCFE